MLSYNIRVSRKHQWTYGIIAMVALGSMLTIVAQDKQSTKPGSPEEMGVRIAIEHYFRGNTIKRTMN